MSPPRTRAFFLFQEEGVIIVGYHGTTPDRADSLVGDPAHHVPSTNPGDWLGRGIYFWQDAPQRAVVWAKRNGLADHEISVVKAEIDLNNCLDLFDLQTYRELRAVYPMFLEHERRTGFVWQQDELAVQNGIASVGGVAPGTRTDIHNLRDRALIDWYIEFLRSEGDPKRSVRGIFLFGRAVYQQSFFFDWSHSQIAVIDPSAIMRPTFWRRP